MNKIRLFVRQCVLISFVFSIALIGSSYVPTEGSFDNYYGELSDVILEDRIYNMNSQVDVRLTSEVRNQIVEYTLGWRKGTERLISKSNIYFPIFDKTLSEYGLPLELKYLSVIESSLRPTVESKAGAVGLWQFMKGTARMYKLKVTRSVDERKDPIKSTDAAARYLKDLHLEFGDWTLALCAYNCGPGRVRKAIKKSGSWNFWTLRKYLPRETRRYIPKFIAASYLMNYYAEHGLMPDEIPFELQYTSSAKIFDRMNFVQISKESGVEMKTIKKLNPSYLYNYIPYNSEGRNVLTLPIDGMNRFLMTNYSAQVIQTAIFNTMAKRESRSILDFVQLPNQYGSHSAYNTQSYGGKGETLTNIITGEAVAKQYEYHKLGKRETLYDFASKREDVSLNSILELNGFTLNNPPRPGTIFKVKQY